MPNFKKVLLCLRSTGRNCRALLQTGKQFEDVEVRRKLEVNPVLGKGNTIQPLQSPALVILCDFLHPSIVQLGYVV